MWKNKRYHIGGLLLLLINSSYAQMVNNHAQISVSSDAILSIATDFLNKGRLTNQGEMLLTGNWTNDGIYDSLEGKLVFNGIEVQEITSNGQEVGNLVIRNGVKTLNDELTVKGELSLISGILQVKEEGKLMLAEDILIEGAASDAYIQGTLYRSGTGDLFYPIGSDEAYLPVTLTEVSGLDPVIGLTAFSESPTQAMGEDIASLSGNYWKLEADENYQSSFITLPYDNVSTMDTASIVVAQAISENTAFQTLGSSSNHFDGENGNVTSKGNAVGAFFTVALVSDEYSLPPLRVINVVTPYQDGKHDFFRIENIELYPNNQVEIFNRVGTKVFSISDYNNRDRVFRGTPNVGGISEIPDGNYFYTIKAGRKKVKAGFLFVKN